MLHSLFFEVFGGIFFRLNYVIVRPAIVYGIGDKRGLSKFYFIVHQLYRSYCISHTYNENIDSVTDLIILLLMFLEKKEYSYKY